MDALALTLTAHSPSPILQLQLFLITQPPPFFPSSLWNLPLALILRPQHSEMDGPRAVSHYETLFLCLRLCCQRHCPVLLMVSIVQ